MLMKDVIEDAKSHLTPFLLQHVYYCTRFRFGLRTRYEEIRA